MFVNGSMGKSSRVVALSSFLVILIFGSMITSSLGEPINGEEIKDHKNTKIQYYSCIDYVTTFHCDPAHNRLVGYGYSGSSIRIHELVDLKPFFVDGKYGKALEIRAPYREAVHVPTLSNITFKDFSVSFWVKAVPKPEPVGQIISYTNSRHTAGWFFDMTANGTNQGVRFVFTDTSGKLIGSPDVSIQPGTFHQITGTFNGSTIRIYSDGQFVGETKYLGRYSGNAGLPFTIGSAAYCASCNRWSGIIDDLRIYGRALTPDQAKQIFDNPDDSEPTK